MERTWDELAGIAKTRREGLGRSQAGVADRAEEVLGQPAISEQTVRKFEKAERDAYRALTLTAISVGLDWPADALARLRAGAPIIEIFQSDETPPPWEELLDGQRRVTEALERLADRIEGRS